MSILIGASFKKRLLSIQAVLEETKRNSAFLSEQIHPVFIKRRLAFGDYEKIRLACMLAKIVGNGMANADADAVLKEIGARGDE